MNSIKTLFTSFFLALFFLTVPFSSEAPRMGGHFEFEPLGQNQFKVLLKINRDCTNISMPDEEEVNIEPEGACADDQVTLNLQNIEDVTSSICEDDCTACNEGVGCLGIGVEEHTYVDTVDLSGFSGCCKIEFSTDPWCCRDGAIENYSSGVVYYEATLNRCADPPPSKPSSELDHQNYVCAGNPQVIKIANSSPEADSVVHQLTDPSPRSGSWSSDYSPQEPLNYLDRNFVGPTGSFPRGFHLSSDGYLKFTPTEEFYGVYAVKTRQYRNDTLLSEIIRERHINVEDFCRSNDKPVIKAQEPTTICAGEENNVSISAYDPDSGKVSINWANKIEGASFASDTGNANVTGIFSWSPDISKVRGQPYNLFVKSHDEFCSPNQQNIEKFDINVNKQPDTTYNYDIQSCGKVNFSTDLQNAEFTQWEINGDTASQEANYEHSFDKGGTHDFTLRLANAGCDTVVIQEQVEVPNFLQLDMPSDTTVCSNEEFVLEPRVRHEEGEVSFEVNGEDFKENTLIETQEDTLLGIKATDEEGCEAVDSLQVNVRQLPEVKAENHYRCPNEDLGVATSDHHPDFEVQWYTEAGQLLDAGPEFPLPETGTYVKEVKDREEERCSVTDTFEVKQAEPLPFTLNDTSLCQGQVLTLDAPVSGESYQWSRLNDETVLSDTDTLKHEPEESLDAVLSVGHTIGDTECYSRDTFAITVHPLPEDDIDPPENACLNEVISLPESQHETDWSGPGVEDGNQWNAAEAGTGNQTLHYTLTDEATGCSTTDSMTTEVLELPELDFTVEPDSGEAPLEVTFDAETAENLFSPSWAIIESTQDTASAFEDLWTFETILPEPQSYTVAFSATDEATGCRDTLTKENIITTTATALFPEETHDIKVYPNPSDEAIHIESKNQVISRVTLHNMNGQQVRQHEPEDESFILRKKDLPGGSYLLRVETTETVMEGKVIFR